MKILQIAPAWVDTPPKGYGGTELVIANLVKAFRTLGHEVTLFATGSSTTSVKLSYVFRQNFLDMGLPWEAALPALLHYHQAFKLSNDYDIVHAHLSSQTDLLTLPFLADLAERSLSAVVTIHGHQPYDRFSGMDKKYFRYYGKKVNALTISKAMKPFAPSQFNLLGMIHNSLDASSITYNPNSGKYLAWLGKILPDKGTHEAIVAAKKAGEQLVFAGIVDKYQKKSVQYYTRKVKPFIDNKQIVYVGPADAKLKNRLLSGAKGFLNPIRWEEPFGMVMLEAMAAGTPVISYNRGSASELIIEGKTGFLVHSLEAMVNAVGKIDSIDRSDCRNHVVADFSPMKAALKHIDVYKKIILEKRKSKMPTNRSRLQLSNRLHHRQIV